MKINKKGFTLIELLVVIAIIGLLSTMAVVSLNSARMKSRDARRLSDVKQLATMMSLASTNSSDPIECGAGVDCVAGNLTVEVTGPADLAAEFQKFHDPSIPNTDWNDVNQACGVAAPQVFDEPCNYSFEHMTNVADSAIYFFLEAGSGELGEQQVHSINSDGVFTPHT
jgi:prepilin-type N-terminal cleavage/methylation domain-containing protein